MRIRWAKAGKVLVRPVPRRRQPLLVVMADTPLTAAILITEMDFDKVTVCAALTLNWAQEVPDVPS